MLIQHNEEYLFLHVPIGLSIYNLSLKVYLLILFLRVLYHCCIILCESYLTGM